MRKIFLFLILLRCTSGVSAQQIFQIWPAVPSGSESWTWKEQVDSLSQPNDPLAYNISKPTLTYFPADPSVASGAAVIICPGGSFCYLHINTEGATLAKWLAKKGIAAFVLRYRVLHSETTQPMQEKIEKTKDTAGFRRAITPVIYLALADAKQAVVYVRSHASELGIAPDKIGIIGFSAGGTLAAATAFHYTRESRPDFAAPIYAFVPASIATAAPADAPPIFIAAASDDELHLVPMSIDVYNKWLSAGRSAELHVYAKGGHGFGMNKQDQPSDSWVERFGDWLQWQGLIKK